MSLAEHIYRKLLWLYPAEHRRAYGQLMVQHARDLSRAARRRGRLHLAALYFRLVIDGLFNAIIEHGQALMTAKGSFQPAPWPSVLLVAVPGLWIALTRRNADSLISLLMVLRSGYILLMIIGLPLVWWRKGRFPVWGLLFAGALTWFLIYKAGMALTQQTWIMDIFGFGRGILFLNIILAITLFVILLRGRGVQKTVWAMIGIMLLWNITAGIIIVYGFTVSGGVSQYRNLQQFFMVSLYWPAEGLMLVAVGLLAARRHGILALLVVVGGYIYMFMDTDYLFGYPSREWSGISLYLFSVCFLFLVVTPVALLRARTRFRQALAVFVPAILFLVARLVVPMLVMSQSLQIRPGDAMLSLNVLLSLILAWMLYSNIGQSTRGVQAGSLEADPGQASS